MASDYSGGIKSKISEELVISKAIEVAPLAPSALKGILSGIFIPITCTHLDAKIHHSLTIEKSAEVDTFEQRIKKDPLGPFRNGALKVAWLNNIIKYGTLIGVMKPVEDLYGHFLPKDALALKVASAATAGFIESIMTSPTAYIASQIKKGQALGKPVGVSEIIQQLPKDRKIKTLYSNFALTGARNITFAIGFFPIIEPIKNILQSTEFFKDRPLQAQVMSSGLSGAFALLLAQPFANAATIARNIGTVRSVDVLKMMFANGGLKKIYGSLTVAAPRVFVASATIALVGEAIEKVFEKVTGLKGTIDHEKLCGFSSGFE